MCDIAFTSKFSWGVHMESEHEGKNLYKCEICAGNFSSIQGVNNHKKLLHEEKKSFKCEVCDANLKSENAFDMHLKFAHDSKYPFTCDICNKVLTSKQELKIHTTNVHEGPDINELPTNVLRSELTELTRTELEEKCLKLIGENKQLSDKIIDSNDENERNKLFLASLGNYMQDSNQKSSSERILIKRDFTVLLEAIGFSFFLSCTNTV